MREFPTGAQGVRFFEYSARVSAFLIFITFVGSIGRAQTTDQIPPTPATGLTATAASCGQVDLSWSASTDTGGSGLKAYTITRSDGVNTTIGAARTTFSDTNYVKSSTTLTYSIVAQDNAGNKSSPGNSVAVGTSACSTSAGESAVDNAYIEPLGKNIANYGARSVLIYVKQNPINLTWDTWLYVGDSDTSQTSRFLLHAAPGYNQTETDYVLVSANELWTLSHDSGIGGKLLISQYRLNGSPPTSATLLSTKSLGDSNSFGKSMIVLKSGGLMVAWNEEGVSYDAAQDLSIGYAYRSPTGRWVVKFPLTVPNSGGGNATMSQMIVAQHPVDGSVWTFVKRDSFYDISALHLTEVATANDFTVDWINPTYIAHTADGNNGPEGEFPFLAAIADPTRNAILLAYQSYHDQFVFIDPLFYESMNSIFLKEAYATIAQVGADGTKTFIPFQTYMERDSQFGFSVLSDGTIWLAYQPINHQTLTWNEVYASRYQNDVWSAPVLADLNYETYNVSSGARDPGILISRPDQPQLAFLTPDGKIHTVDLSNLGPAPADTISPTTSVTNPASGTAVSGIVSVSASASDNVGVASVQLLVDGAVVGTAVSAPYNFSWNTAAVTNGSHTVQTKAFDAAGNVGLSGPVAVIVSNLNASGLAVAITNPKNGSTVPRNQKVTVSASVTDNSKVTRMDFYVNSTLLGSVATVPYNYPWKVPAKRGALYNVQAKAYDALGNNAAQTITVSAQ